MQTVAVCFRAHLGFVLAIILGFSTSAFCAETGKPEIVALFAEQQHNLLAAVENRCFTIKIRHGEFDPTAYEAVPTTMQFQINIKPDRARSLRFNDKDKRTVETLSAYNPTYHFKARKNDSKSTEAWFIMEYNKLQDNEVSSAWFEDAYYGTVMRALAGTEAGMFTRLVGDKSFKILSVGTSDNDLIRIEFQCDVNNEFGPTRYDRGYILLNRSMRNMPTESYLHAIAADISGDIFEKWTWTQSGESWLPEMKVTRFELSDGAVVHQLLTYEVEECSHPDIDFTLESLGLQEPRVVVGTNSSRWMLIAGNIIALIIIGVAVGIMRWRPRQQ